MAIRPDLVTPEEDEELLRWYERNYPGLVRRVPDEPIGDQPPMPPEGELPSEPAPSDTPFLQDALGGILGLLSGDTSGMGQLMSRIGLDDVSMPSFLPPREEVQQQLEQVGEQVLPDIDFSGGRQPGQFYGMTPNLQEPGGALWQILGAYNYANQALKTAAEKYQEAPGLGPVSPGRLGRGELEFDPLAGYPEGIISRDGGPGINPFVAQALGMESPYGSGFLERTLKTPTATPGVSLRDYVKSAEAGETLPIEEQLAYGGIVDLATGGAGKIVRGGTQAVRQIPGAIDFLSAQGPALKSAAQQGLLAPIMPGIQAGTPGGVPRRVGSRPELASELEDLRAMVDDRYMDNLPRLLKTPEGGFSLVRARNVLRSYLDDVNPDEFTSLDKFSELDYRLGAFDDIQRGNYERGADGAQRFQDEREFAWEEVLDALDELEIKAADDIVDAPPTAVTPATPEVVVPEEPSLMDDAALANLLEQQGLNPEQQSIMRAAAAISRAIRNSRANRRVVPDEPSPAALTPEQQAGLDVTGFDDIVEQAGIPAEATVETAATVSRKNLHPRTSNLLRDHYGRKDFYDRLALGEFHDEAGNPIRIAAARAKIADEAVPETVPEVSPETVPEVSPETVPETVPEPVVQPSVAAAADMPANVPDSMADLFSEVGGVEKFKQSGFEGMRRQARGRDESPKIWILTFKSADEPNRIVLRALDNTPENTRAIREMVKAGQARNIGPNMRVRSRGQTDPDRLEYVDESGQIVHEADTVIGDDIEIAIEQAMKMARETQGMPDVAVPYHVVRRGFGFDEFAEGPIAGSIPETTPAVITPEVIPPDHPAVVAASEEGISIRQIDDATGEATDLTPGEPLDLTSTETPNTGRKLIDDYIERVQGNDPDARQADMTLEESLIDDMENYPYVPDDGGDGIPPGRGGVVSPDTPENPSPVSNYKRRVMSWVSDIINAPRAIMSSGEQSSLLRQGGILFKAHPIIGAKVTANTFKTFFSEAKFAERDAFYRAQPNFDRYVNQSKLYWADTGDITKREEEFISRLLMKVPVLKTILRASERHFTMFLNALRYEVADQLVKSWDEAAEGKAITDVELDAITNFVNHATGRGELGKGAWDRILGDLNIPFFSPRFWLSRYQLIWDLIGTGKGKSMKVRSLIARDLATSTITNMMLMSLFAAGGAKVGMNHRGSNFGKVRFPGGQEIDLWEGRQQLFRFVMETISGEGMTPAGKKYDKPRSETLGRYVQSKFNPGIPSMVVDFKNTVTGGLSSWMDTGEWIPGIPRDFMGEEIEMTGSGLTKYATSKITPLYAQEIWEAFAEEGLVATPEQTLSLYSKKGRENWGKILKGKDGAELKRAFGIEFSRMDEFSWSEFQKVWAELDIDPDSAPPMLLRPTGSGVVGTAPLGWFGVGTNTYRTLDELVREIATGAGIEDKVWPFERSQIVEDIRNQGNRELTGYSKRMKEINYEVQQEYAKIINPLPSEYGGEMREDWHIRSEYFRINADAAIKKQVVSEQSFGNSEMPISESAMASLPEDSVFKRFLDKSRIFLRDGYDTTQPITILGKDYYFGVTGTPSDKYDKALSDYYDIYRDGAKARAIGTDAHNKKIDQAEARWRREGTLEYVQANTHTRPVPDALFEKLPETTQDKIDASKAARAKRSRQAGKYVPKVKTPQITGEKSKNPSITPKPKSEKSIPPTPSPFERTPRPTLEPWWEKYENRSVP